MQPPSAEALELVSRLRKLQYSWHELNLFDAGKAIDALIAQRVAAEAERWQNRDRQRLEQIDRLQGAVQSAQSASAERPAPEGPQPARRLTQGEVNVMNRALRRSTRLIQ